MNRLIVSIGTAALLCACVTDNKETKDYTAYVNPFIGTGGHGHTFPGAVVPFGMIQPSPDTRIDGWDACSGVVGIYYHAGVVGRGKCEPV